MSEGMSWIIHTEGEGKDAHLEVTICHPNRPQIEKAPLSAEGALLLAADLIRHAQEIVAGR